jgi:phage terminase Nu1 subunit (DNA packaging protein)
MAAERGGEAASAARARLGSAQADLTETKAQRLRGELVEASEVEALWTSSLTQELRAALTELAGDKRDRVRREHGKSPRTHSGGDG